MLLQHNLVHPTQLLLSKTLHLTLNHPWWLSHVRLFATPWTIAHQSPLSVGFSRQECWSALPFPSPEDLPDPGIEPMSSALAGDSLPVSHQGSPELELPNSLPCLFPECSSDGKESTCSAGDPGSIPGSGRSPGERNVHPLQYSCLENFMERSSLVGYSSWGHKSWTQLSN